MSQPDVRIAALQQTAMAPVNSYRAMVILYAALGLLLMLVFTRVSPAAEHSTRGGPSTFRLTLAGLSGIEHAHSRRGNIGLQLGDPAAQIRPARPARSEQALGATGVDEGGERVRASYRDNFPRLLEVKRRYDPDNRFRVNHNIAPRPGAPVAAAAPPR